MNELQLQNTRTKKRDTFKPLSPKKTTIYVCGITPYDTTHLGHAFTYISFDVLIRYLEYLGHRVTYTQNVTDINDRDSDILERAKEQHMSWEKLAEYWTKRFLTDMKSLNWHTPDNYLKASEHLPTMILLIKKLLINNVAYKKNGSIYLDITHVKNYGALSGLTSAQMLTLAKEFEEDTENTDKRNKLDITLWRAKDPHQPRHIPSFDSPYGKGRPGWHIECSAMAVCSLGEQIDIHGGGIDLLFPHHEAEVAQSESATGKRPFANFWLHSASVSYKGAKMSKSLGNLVMLESLLKKYSPNVIRFMLLSHHYQKSWEFKEKDMEKAQKDMEQIENFIKDQKSKKTNQKITDRFENYLNDNLSVNKYLDWISAHVQSFTPNESGAVCSTLITLGFTFP